MTNTQIEKLLVLSEKYPLHVRIAALLTLEGVTTKDYHKMIKSFPYVPEPYVLNVYNSLTDIQNNHIKMTKELIELAKRIK